MQSKGQGGVMGPKNPFRKFTAVFLAFASLLFIAAFWGAFPAMAKDQPVPLDDDTVSIRPDIITDKLILEWIGKWEGNMITSLATMPMEVVWKMSVYDQWLEGNMTIWTDMDKQKIYRKEIVYMRPTSIPRTYKIYSVDNVGVGLTASAVEQNGSWNWSWDYDTGQTETGTLTTPGKDKWLYSGAVADPSGKNMLNYTYDLKKVTVGHKDEKK
jgi:hypothetical protein